jgi:ABC-type Mn2+/Zn2+ transport system permease subunit
MDSLREILQYSFLQRALLAAVIIGFANGAFGTFVILKKSALVAGNLSHALLPGIAAAILAAGLVAWNLFLGALGAALIVVLSSVAVSRNSRLDQGTAMAVILTGAFALGVIIVDHLPPGQVNLEDYLFGNILNVHRGDLWVVFVIGAVTLLTVTALQRPILLTLFEPSVAAAQGVPVRALNYLLMTLLVLVMVASLQAVGCILSLVMICAPAATIYLLSNSTQLMFWGGGALGAVGSAAGVILAHLLNQRPGNMITLILVVAFLAAFVLNLTRRRRPQVR